MAMNRFEYNSNLSVRLIVFVSIIALVGVCAPKIFENVPNGKYHIKQSVISGEITAYMKPGMYWQNFGHIVEWPIAETFYFTKDKEGGSEDWSIEVRFNDGSICHISGTCRVDMPRTEQEAIDLISKHGYRDFDQVEDKLLLPTIRRSLVMTANLMSAKESYSERRADFFAYAWDQIENGIYVTQDLSEKDTDPVSGVIITKIKKEIMKDEKGNPIREKTNPLQGLGIKLSNFEIKNFVYEDKVQKQIGAQQEAIMAVQTARAKAQESQQDALTAEAKGKAAVMTAKYEKEQEKVRATVEADKEKEVAVIAATKLVEVATKTKEQALIAASQEKEVTVIMLEAAKNEKQKQIELGTGESERRRLVMSADGALTQKLEAMIAIQKSWAEAYAKRNVPTTVMGSSAASGVDNDASDFMKLMTMKAAKDLSLDMGVKTPQVNK